MPYAFQPNISLEHAPTLWQFIHDDNPVRIITGPVGSGKTTICCGEVMSRALQQKPSPDGVRRFKAGIVRNTMPELRRTTIPTWLALFPENATAPLRYSTPAEHRIQIRAKDFKWIDREAGTYEGSPGLELIVEFFALDRPEDVSALLSWEGTMIWFNEVREIHKSIVDMADLRVESLGLINPFIIELITFSRNPSSCFSSSNSRVFSGSKLRRICSPTLQGSPGPARITRCSAKPMST